MTASAACVAAVASATAGPTPAGSALVRLAEAAIMMEARRAATLSACATPDNLGALASGLSGASCPPGRVAARFAAATLATPAFVTGGNHVFGLCTETFRLQVSVHGADVVAPAWAGGAKSPDGACFHG